MQEKMFSWSNPAAAATSDSPELMHRGVALVIAADGSCLLCIGRNTGIVQIFAAHSADRIQHCYELCHHQYPIAALAAGSLGSHNGAVSASYLASCDDNGTINVCQATSATTFDLQHRWEGHGVPCVSVGIKNLTLIAAFYDGSVRLYSLVSHTCCPALS